MCVHVYEHTHQQVISQDVLYLSNVYHAQVVHKTGPVLPDLRWGATEWLHSNFLTAVQFPYCPHHHMHRIKHQRWRELWKGERRQERYRGGERQRGGGMETQRGKTRGQGRRCNEERAEMIEWLKRKEAGKIREEREKRCEVWVNQWGGNTDGYINTH